MNIKLILNVNGREEILESDFQEKYAEFTSETDEIKIVKLKINEARNVYSNNLDVSDYEVDELIDILEELEDLNAADEEVFDFLISEFDFDIAYDTLINENYRIINDVAEYGEEWYNDVYGELEGPLRNYINWGEYGQDLINDFEDIYSFGDDYIQVYE